MQPAYSVKYGKRRRNFPHCNLQQCLGEALVHRWSCMRCINRCGVNTILSILMCSMHNIDYCPCVQCVPAAVLHRDFCFESKYSHAKWNRFHALKWTKTWCSVQGARDWWIQIELRTVLSSKAAKWEKLTCKTQSTNLSKLGTIFTPFFTLHLVFRCFHFH